ncbi:MAG: dinitrogenase iron-molybdenum cofactor [Actinobacteria bacterium]|nr:dinitrogenase iron-molybdenum cofactor [Actinomycetota bacterium]
MIICIPITTTGEVDPRWGRADWVALAEIDAGKIVNWHEVEVSWSTLHDEGTHGSHHARVVKFLRDNNVNAVVANHMGDGMTRMLKTMDIPVYLGANGNARTAIQVAIP